MGIYQTDWHWIWASGDGYHSVEVNLPPAWIAAEVSVHGDSGGGTHYTGIRKYRKRLSSGADKVKKFGEWYDWPPMIFDYVSSITFSIANGSNQQTGLIARMDYWS